MTMGASAVHGGGGAAGALDAEAPAEATGAAAASALGAGSGAGGAGSFLEQPATTLTESADRAHTYETAAIFIRDPSLDGEDTEVSRRTSLLF